MEADWPLQEVRRLQARLAASTKPRKLHKYLRRLSALPMTADLLAHTRVRKTVKALRRYEIVGSVARDLAAQWKKLARAHPSPGQAQQDSPPSHSRKRPWAALDEDQDNEREEEEDDEEKEEEEDQEEEDQEEEEDEEEGNDEDEDEEDQEEEENEEDQEENEEEDQEKEDQEDDQEEEEDDEDEVEDEDEEDKEEEQADRGAPEPGTAVGSQPAKPAHGLKRPRRLSELEPPTLESPWRPRQALPRSARPAQEWADTCTWHEEDPDPDPAAGLRQPAHGPARAPHHGAGPLPDAPREEAQGKAGLSQGQTHKWTPRENGPLRAKAGEAPPASLGQLSARGVSREENGAKGKPPASGRPRTPLWSLPQLAADQPGKAKRKEPRASRAEKTRQHPQSCQLRPGPEDPRPGLQHISTHVEAAHAHLAAAALASGTGGLLQQAEAQPAGGGGGEGGGQELPHQPTMSFEAYMTYDHLEKTQRKAGRPWAAALRGKGPQPAEPPSRGPGAHWLQKCPEGTHSQQGKLQPAGAHAAKLQDSGPAAAPSTQARDGPSPRMPSCPPRTKAPSAAQQEEDAGLSGGRSHPKMQVYAGAKHSTPGIPESPMCIPRLEPIASPSAGRGVPPSLPGPLREQHTPEELQRGERDNPELLEETDPLWKRHCHRDFQGEQPAGQESWRQMDLRLQSAGERCLQALTAAIPCTHASKPKGRPTKRNCFHGLPGPAGDAPGRQDALQTGGASAPRASDPTGSDRAPSSSTQHSDSSLSPPPAHRPAQLGPSMRLAPWAPGGTTRKQVPPGGSTRKQAPKKIAPLMAKSIRHYKKTLSRR